MIAQGSTHSVMPTDMIHFETLNADHKNKDPLTNATPLTKQSTSQLLTSIITAADKHQIVFDLDSTLLDNKERNAVIMREFAQAHHEPQLAIASARHFPDWSAKNSMRSMGLDESKINALLDAHWAFWSERFFTSEYCRFDIAVPGAQTFVQSILRAGGDICYLTGRHEGMRDGTQLSLQKLGFPLPGSDRVTLLMKRDQDEPDDSYKAHALESLRSGPPVLAAFDNEPTHINSYRTAFSDAICVHLFTDHSMREVKLLDKIYSIYNFDF